ncbi:hypothetical protein K458DRAFT_74301 [Lentithecium fluviatile CBS 122367]|uniref:Uncharacterized protein n=1 Tax=Lentithecium fluviatile CBS 122367 TaxID=1168545 RepID=A0A6G1IUI6_9PLEO|nr:hypothetical protein K458DRAFT_74301 [Lentithecium fluviatile CBS 122367]
MSATQDITSFSGFGSWMSSFTPQESDDRKEAEELDGTRPEPDHSVFVHELPADYAHDPKELDANANPVDVKAPYPQPIPPPAPQPRPRPQPSPVPPHRKRVSVQRLPVYQEMPDPISTIQVHGLQKVGASGRFTDTIRISRYGHLFDINTAVRTKVPQ